MGLILCLTQMCKNQKFYNKLVRNSESINATLDKTLHQAENDHQKLISQLKQKNQDAKISQNRLRVINNQINQSKITQNNVLAQSEKNKVEAGANAANLNNQVARRKQLSAKIAAVQSNIRSEQSQLDLIISSEQKLRKQHFLGLMIIKSQMENWIVYQILLNEYQLINKELIDEIDIYADQNQQAISILNRKDQMKELINRALRKLKVTEETIKNVKY